MELFIIRHGESNSNIGIKSISDSPLSENGLKQARFTLECLQDNQLDVIVCSPLTRALQTAQPLARQLNLPIHIWFNIHENATGAPSRTGTPKQISEQFPEVIFEKTVNPEGEIMAGYETAETSLLRAYTVLNQLLRKYKGKRVAVFGHAGFNTNLHLACMGFSHPSNVYILQNNTSMSWFSFKEELTMLNYFGDMRKLDWTLESSIFRVVPW